MAHESLGHGRGSATAHDSLRHSRPGPGRSRVGADEEHVSPACQNSGAGSRGAGLRPDRAPGPRDDTRGGRGRGHRHGRHKRAGRRPAAQWRPRSHVFLLSPGLCDLLVGALGPAIGRLCAQPGSGGGGGGQGASSLRGPLTQLLQPQTLTPGLREAHQTREQRGGFSTVPPGPRGQRQSLRPSQSGVDSARHRDSRPQTERSLGRGLPRGGGRRRWALVSV